MNSSEQKDFEHITPTGDEIAATIREVEVRLAEKMASNEFTEGYQEVLRILNEGKKSYDDISEDLPTDEARALAVLAVDYLNGECSEKVLLGYNR